LHSTSTFNPDYSKPFHLNVAEKAGYANAVLMQKTPTGKQHLAYYSSKLYNIEAGLPPCYQGLTAAAFPFQKASILTMGHSVTHSTPVKCFARKSKVCFNSDQGDWL